MHEGQRAVDHMSLSAPAASCCDGDRAGDDSSCRRTGDCGVAVADCNAPSAPGVAVDTDAGLLRSAGFGTLGVLLSLSLIDGTVPLCLLVDDAGLLLNF